MCILAVLSIKCTEIARECDERRPWARGVSFGRPPKFKDDQKKLVLELVNTGKSISPVARTFNVHPATIYRGINEYRSL